MQHIMIIASYAPSLINFRGPLLRSLINDGHKVTAIAPLEDHLSETSESTIADDLRDMGVDFRPVSLSRTGIDPLKDIGYCLSLRSLIKEIKPDRILAYTIKPVIYAGIASRSLRHGNYFPMFTGLGYAFTKGAGLKKKIVNIISSRLLRFALKKSKTVIFQNPDDQALIRELNIISAAMPSKIVDGSGVDLTHYARETEKQSEPPLTFLMIARLLLEKGVREYARAAQQLKAQYPETKFTLVGPIDTGNPASPDRREISSWTAVDYLGPSDDVRPHLENCDVYVLPSYREGTPRTVLEAMACKRAIITTDAPGCRETVIEGENGFLVPPRDAQSLQKTIEKFILNSKLCKQMGGASFELVKRKYDVNIVNQALKEIMKLSV